MDSKVIKDTLQNIYNLIKYTFKYKVIYRLPIDVLEGKKQFSSIDRLCENLMSSVEQSDLEFVGEFVKTQMFTYYME